MVPAHPCRLGRGREGEAVWLRGMAAYVEGRCLAPLPPLTDHLGSRTTVYNHAIIIQKLAQFRMPMAGVSNLPFRIGSLDERNRSFRVGHPGVKLDPPRRSRR